MGRDFQVVFVNSAILKTEIFKIREKVFVEEQGVDKAREYDEFETSSVHLAVLLDGNVIGTCRYRNTQFGVKLERFAILKEYRGLGAGSLLVNKILDELGSKARIYLHAQTQVVDFYKSFGFEKKGAQFQDAGIGHYKMVLT